MPVFPCFFARIAADGRFFLKKPSAGGEPSRALRRITLSPTEPERRGQDGLGRVGRLVAIWLRGAWEGRPRQGVRHSESPLTTAGMDQPARR